MNPAPSSDQRLHALDAVRGFALLLGVAFHAALSFMPGWPPGIWAMVDNSPSPFLSDAAFVIHIFRMSLFFFIAGYFGRLLHARLGTRAFWANRLKRILIPLIAGWVVIFPAISYIWIRGLTKVFGGTLPPMPPMPQVPGAFPLTHLWFLYQLLMIYVVVLATRALITRLIPSMRSGSIVDSVVSVSIKSMGAVLVLGLPVAIALNALPMWFYWQGIPTPDQSLIPQWPASIGFGTAFVFGWLVHRSTTALVSIEQRWLPHLLIAAVSTAFLMRVMHSSPMAQPGLTKTFYALAFGVALWAWVFGLTGAALKFLSNFSATRRYIADASYWIYLAHLPVVAAFQVWVGHWSLHWSMKYPFVLLASFTVLFVSYHYLVRSTALGVLLNGRKHPRQKHMPAETMSPPSSITHALPNSEPVASLRGVTKRYGSTTALNGISLDVRPGELLAVLGPNGAGKSTAIALWLGLIEPDTGEVDLLGGSPLDIARRRGVGVMMQGVDLVKELRVHELIELAASYYAHPMSVRETLDLTGTTALANKLYGKLSGGQQRQVQFAIAICGRPQVLFLDEPTVGLDLQAREALWTNIRMLLANSCSVILTTHYLEEAEALATRVAVIVRGRVVASGSVDDMRALVASRQISCETTLSIDDVRAWRGVTQVKRDRTKLTITASDGEAIVQRLFAADPTLRRLEVKEAGLAEAFSEITKEAA